MKIYIGNYPSDDLVHAFGEWLVDKLIVSEEISNKIIKFLKSTWLGNLRLSRSRKIKIKIDDYDVWNLDDTLVTIIRPLLHKFAKYKTGAPFVDPTDVPQNMWPKWYINGDEYKEGMADETYFKRWDYIFSEIVWTFDTLDSDWESLFYKDIENASDDFDVKGYDEYNNRIKNGLLMFGKYFRGLWN